MSKASDNPYPSLLFAETAVPSSPTAGKQRLFVDPADHLLKAVDSTGAVTVQGGGLDSAGVLALIGAALVEGTGITITDNLDGTWTFDATGGGGGGATTLDGLTDVVLTGPAGGQVVWYDGVEWVNHYLFLDNLFDVNAPTPADGDVLTFDTGTGEWGSAAPTGGGSVPSASTTVQGIVELATNTETTTGTDTTRAVTPAGVKAAIDALIAGAPGALDTLAEIAAQLATDESAVSALTTTVGTKLAKASNLSDLANAGTARTNLGLGGAAVLAVGTTAGTVAAGDDSRMTNARTPTAHASSHAAGGSDALALDDSQVAPVAPNDQTGTTYTFVLADKHRLVRASNAAAQTYTIPPNSSVAYPLGTVLQIAQQAAGQATLTAGAGVTLRSPRGAKTAVQYAMAQAVKVAADEWYVSGDVTT